MKLFAVFTGRCRAGPAVLALGEKRGGGGGGRGGGGGGGGEGGGDVEAFTPMVGVEGGKGAAQGGEGCVEGGEGAA